MTSEIIVPKDMNKFITCLLFLYTTKLKKLQQRYHVMQKVKKREEWYIQESVLDFSIKIKKREKVTNTSIGMQFEKINKI